MRFSVLTITFNAEKYLKETIQSVARQNFKSYEHLIWDGGSTDATVEIIKNFNHIKFFQGKDEGIADAMNKVAQLAQGDYLVHLHGDDLFACANVLKKVNLALVQHKEPVWLYGQALLINEYGNVHAATPFEYYDRKRLKKYNFITHPSVFVSRKAFEAIGGFKKTWKYCMDYDLWLRLSQYAPPYAMASPLSCFRQHEGSLSTREKQGVANEAYEVRKQYAHSFIEKLHSYRTWKKRIKGI